MANSQAIAKLLTQPQPLYGENMSSKADIEQARRYAQLLREDATSAAPVQSWTQAMARALQGYVSGAADRDASAKEQARNKLLGDLLANGGDPKALEAASISMGAPELMQVAGNRRDQANADRSFGFQQDRAKVGDQQWQQGFGLQKDQFGFQQNRANVADSQWQQEFNANQSKPIEVNGVLVDPKTYQPVYTGAPKLTDDQAEYQGAVAQGYKGSFVDYQKELKKAGATNVTVGGEPALSKELSKNEGKAWAGYLDSATTSSGAAQDMQILDELIKVAPQGPVTGRLAQMFPGVSSAGAAFQSVIKRVAPSLRQPGSGAQSDIEYQGFLDSLPSLVNMPEANNAISSFMKAKAQLNMERGQIVADYQNKRISDQEARTRLQEVNKRSIMTPEMRSIIEGLSGGSNGGAPDYSLQDIDAELRRRGVK